uniref:Cathepsin propeptide inhibitor domain-containing protein n=1 Tax=Trieres chinensis TaxID=1514140 RepID=A0A7S2EMM6_TRICV|mmetsp:Transcript_29668/g.60589  ORF Transcript_29668/g.60589 Transcript_29668/m.60589 type:complete len:164 (+) Transcript_29668:179-670(+)|eukprot:CAMPEP_0183300550 /NCGR_PEP_ID=MMETSP0160_2-20130417/6940_1 /TAXON_ID=2839 ORGANISM="Odontella Sinensis, Strain Grunow 1884" /NCGR_SAMPLE_ID=MMETSP0160_2 /ASSEMBLY_ACC=CAM_ASM_000250 /LENGTH=163 /DNA_ID=CAMNT_0025462991 /DNA_START=144 /DNA_END=635 /DNA_ORIENTATION=-
MKAIACVLLAASCSAFIPEYRSGSCSAGKIDMVGGRGWENGNYLESLGGDDDDQKEANEKYEEFHQSRQAFLERQKKIMDTEQGKRFMQQRMQQESDQRMTPEWDGMMMEGVEQTMGVVEGGEGFEFGSGGGSRMRNLMMKSGQMQANKRKQEGGMNDEDQTE